MKVVLKIFTAVILLLLVVVALEIIASESGEVVVLHTQGSDGEPAETRLWVVDHQGSAWLRSGSPASGWYQRLLANGQVQVQRGADSFAAQAQPDVALREEINSLMAQKYGWADQYISLLFGREDAIPVQLVLSP